MPMHMLAALLPTVARPAFSGKLLGAFPVPASPSLQCRAHSKVRTL
jgi:hypothetical protein